MTNHREEIYSKYLEHAVVSGQTPSQYSYAAWASAAEHYIRGWLPESKRSRVLDLGCGAGYFLKMLHAKGYSDLTGIDLSQGQIALAKEAVPGAKLVCGNCREFLSAETGKYALITGFDFLEHLTKDELLEMLKLINKALVPGGRVIFQTPNPDSPFGMKVRYGDFTHESAVSPGSLHSILKIAGLGEYEVRECGPYPHGVVSFVRYVLWRIAHYCFVIFNLIETGNSGGGVWTRVFVAAARKK